MPTCPYTCTRKKESWWQVSEEGEGNSIPILLVRAPSNLSSRERNHSKTKLNKGLLGSGRLNGMQSWTLISNS